MISAEGEGGDALQDLALALSVFALDPIGTGLIVRSGHGPLREQMLERLAEVLGDAPNGGEPWLRVPLGISEDRLLGGLDLGATLASGRPVAARGLLAEADGKVVLLPLADQLPAARVAELCAVIDRGVLVVAREGVSETIPTRFGVIALDESEAGEQGCPAALADRLLLHLTVPSVSVLQGALDRFELADPEALDAARARLGAVVVPDVLTERACAIAEVFGVASLRAVSGTLRVARALCALFGEAEIDDDVLAVAARLVLAPRATRMPAPDEAERESEPEMENAPEESSSDATEQDSDRDEDESGALGADTEMMLEAVAAAVPADVLAAITEGARRGSAPRQGRAGQEAKAGARGRPAGVRAGAPRRGERLAVVETLRAAAPWQGVRGRRSAAERVQVRADDFRVVRRRARRPTLTIFVVDASGSAAVQRLAEAKGAVEHLLAECYVRRDEVAVVAFRGTEADVLLPPTRSLLRARRSITGLPGGGGTPLAAGLLAADRIAEEALRQGTSPLLVLLTDGRANVTLAGESDRRAAQEELSTLARRLSTRGVGAVVIDTSRRPGAAAETLARDLGARYRPLPVADAAAVSAAVRDAQMDLAA